MANAFEAIATEVPGFPGAHQVQVSGRITFGEAPALRRELLHELARTPGERLVLGLSGIEQMDTSGAAVIAETVRAAFDSRKRVLLCSPSEAVVRIFRLAGFEDVLERCCVDPDETARRLEASGS